MDEDEEIKKAREVLEDLSNDAHERELAEYRLKYILDNKAIEKAGYLKGKKAGLQQGQQQGIIQTASKMKQKGIDTKTIIEVTGLSQKEIEKL